MSIRARFLEWTPACSAVCVAVLMAGCSGKTPSAPAGSPSPSAAPTLFQVDSATAGAIHGTVQFSGKRPVAKPIDMSSDPACVEANKGKGGPSTSSVGPHGAVASAFLYVKKGLEGKTFAIPSTPVTIDQRGCWFRPQVLGVQTGQSLEVINSDPVTHNIHPMAEVNREWNHSQGPGDAPLRRKFGKPEIMIPVKCNIHAWMKAFIGVVEHPYFTVSGEDGTFKIANLPPGTYTVGLWQQELGTAEQQITVPPHGDVSMRFDLKGK